MEEEKVIITLFEPAETRFEEKKSVFIGFAAPIHSEEEAMSYLKETRKKYPDATHHVWAYLLKDGALARYSDDGEPQGTAGVPVLEAIKKKGITDVVVIVTRYFGGTLLGAGGLVRCYTKSAHEAIEAGKIARYESFAELEILCDYSDYQRIQKELSGFGTLVDRVDFAENVLMKVAVPLTDLDPFCRRMSEITNARAKIEKSGIRMDRKSQNGV